MVYFSTYLLDDPSNVFGYEETTGKLIAPMFFHSFIFVLCLFINSINVQWNTSSDSNFIHVMIWLSSWQLVIGVRLDVR